jgi:hypothetical protein
MIAISRATRGRWEIAMAELPPDQTRRLLLNRLMAAKAEADLLEAATTASLIGMAILSIDPSWTDGEPVAQNDNRSAPDKA